MLEAHSRGKHTHTHIEVEIYDSILYCDRMRRSFFLQVVLLSFFLAIKVGTSHIITCTFRGHRNPHSPTTASMATRPCFSSISRRASNVSFSPPLVMSRGSQKPRGAWAPISPLRSAARAVAEERAAVLAEGAKAEQPATMAENTRAVFIFALVCSCFGVATNDGLGNFVLSSKSIAWSDLSFVEFLTIFPACSSIKKLKILFDVRKKLLSICSEFSLM